MAAVRKPKIAVWKFASCDGCQLSLLDCEDELLSVVGAVEIANFPEATRRQRPLRYFSRRRLHHYPARRRTHSHDSPLFQAADHHRRVRHFRRHPGLA